MKYLIGGFILITFNASAWWWAGYFIFVILEVFATLLEARKTLKEVKQSKKPQLLKANGDPYTEADLEFIWKHGYQSALEMVQQTKQ